MAAPVATAETEKTEQENVEKGEIAGSQAKIAGSMSDAENRAEALINGAENKNTEHKEAKDGGGSPVNPTPATPVIQGSLGPQMR